MEPVVERPESDVLEDQLEPEVLVVVTDSHEEEDVRVGDPAEVVQLRLTGSLPHSHLGQVPHLPHHPAVWAHWEHHGVSLHLKVDSYRFVCLHLHQPLSLLVLSWEPSSRLAWCSEPQYWWW